MAKKFFAKPSTKTPMTRPTSASSSKRRQKPKPLGITMPHKGDERGRRPTRGMRYPNQ